MVPCNIKSLQVVFQNALSIKHALNKSYMVDNWYGLNGFFNLFFQNFNIAGPQLPDGIHYSNHLFFFSKVMTYKQKFNKKYGFDKDESHSISDIAQLTGYDKAGLEIIYDKGMGAYFTNPQSVRPKVTSPEQWAAARLYSAVMGGKAQRIDAQHLNKN